MRSKIMIIIIPGNRDTRPRQFGNRSYNYIVIIDVFTVPLYLAVFNAVTAKG